MIELKETIKQIIDSAQAPALLCSWGRDSSLLFYYVRQVKLDIAVYFFGDTLPELAAQMVVEEGLTVCSFAPLHSFLSQDSLIDEYSFNGISVPMLSPLVTSDGCRHSHLKTPTVDFHFPHDVVLWGYRRADAHPLLPGMKFDREIKLAHTKFIAPLYDLTTDQVLNTLDALDLSYVTDSPVEICENCMNALISNATTLAGFQERPLSH